ncbi:MAG TPA: ABC transporter permease [Fimbriimonadaceae bacterium]|jgi:ribose transport system permease protein
MRRSLLKIFGSQQFGLVVVIIILSVVLTSFAGSHTDLHGNKINNFLNAGTIIQVLTETSFFAIMAVGSCMVIITGGIDLSVGSIYALSATGMAMVLRAYHLQGPTAILVGMVLACSIGLICGLLNGVMVFGLKVHPFVITLGTMWIYRGISFVTSKAESILVPQSLTDFTKASLGLGNQLYPVPLIVMILVTVVGGFYLVKTVAGRRIFAVGGNVLASVYSGVRVNKVYLGVYVIAGLTAGIAAFVGTGYYGSASCGDAQGYELYVIAAAVVGGVSLLGGKGSALGATLGALLIVLIRQAISTLHWDDNYEWIIIGVAIIVAVVLDRISSTLGTKQLARAASGL